MGCFAVRVYFVNSCEVASFTVSEPIRLPFAALQRILFARGADAFSAAWSDGYNNLYPLKSDQHFADALAARHHTQPLRIFVKESRHPGHLTFVPAVRQRSRHHVAPGAEGGSAMGPWSDPHKITRERADSFGGRKDGLQQHYRLNFQAQCRQEMRNVPRMPHPPLGLMNDTSVLPKDPSLSELVDKLRHNLDLVASMHSSHSNEPVACVINGIVSIAKEEPASSEQEAVLLSDSKTIVGPAAVVMANDAKSGAEHYLSELLEEFSEQEQEVELARALRPESAMSDDFIAISPGSDSCVHFNMEDFEAIVSDLDDLDSEDTFEIVDTPEDWDSDIEWKEVEV